MTARLLKVALFVTVVTEDDDGNLDELTVGGQNGEPMIVSAKNWPTFAATGIAEVLALVEKQQAPPVT